MASSATLRTALAVTGFLLVAGFFLMTEHRAHIFGLWPFLLILACPLLHIFLHRGHGSSHGHDGGRHDEGGHRGGHSDRAAAAPADQSAAEQSDAGARRRQDSPHHSSPSEVA